MYAMFDSLKFFFSGRTSNKLATQRKIKTYENSRQSYDDKEPKGSDTSSETLADGDSDSLLTQHELVMNAHSRGGSRAHLEFLRLVLAVVMSVALTVVAMHVFRAGPRLAWEDKDSGLPLMPIPERKSLTG